VKTVRRGRFLPWSPGAVALTVVLAVVVGIFPGIANSYQLYAATLGATYLIAAVGLNVLVGYAGVISLGSSAFAMVGGYTVGITNAQWGFGIVEGVVLAVVVSTAVGFITALPALRLGPFAVAVVTVGYLSAATAIVALYPGVTGGPDGLPVPATSLTGPQFWYMAVGIAAVVWILQYTAMRSPLGRALTVSRLSPVLAGSLGVSHLRMKLVAFAVSGGLAGLAGSIYPLLNGQVNTSTFNVSLSILLLLMVVLGGQGTLSGPVIGAIILTVVSYVLDEVFKANGNQTTLIYGVFLLAAVVFFPNGIIGTFIKFRWAIAARFGVGKARADGVGPAAAGRPEPLPAGPMELTRMLGETTGGRLVLDGVGKSFGGVGVLHDVGLVVEAGTVHGLIGPNGSGKTTALNCVSGLLSSRGQVSLDSARLARRPAARARAGIARTFQQPLLENDTSALDNILVGVDARRRAGWPAYLIRTPKARREARESRATAVAWLAALGLAEVAGEPAGTVPPGKQRLLEVGRALATRPKIILLDEPAAGLNEAEIERLEEAIRAVRRAGVSVLLVDHHVDLILRLCDQITVLAQGSVIAKGTPQQIQTSAAVIDAYLGRRGAGGERAVPVLGGRELALERKASAGE
jgi:ABC-type branched-subunit amino acid transport system ATPase component/ABC-type branched-subunit amino acid transport system permease subunit